MRSLHSAQRHDYFAPMQEQWDGLIRDFGKTLKQENKSANTIELYTSSARRFVEWLAEHGRLGPVAEVTRRDVSDWISELLETRKPSTANGRYRALQQWWNFLINEEEIESSPMERMKPPHVPETPVPVLPLERIKELLKLCDGKDLISRRDTSIIRLLPRRLNQRPSPFRSLEHGRFFLTPAL